MLMKMKLLETLKGPAINLSNNSIGNVKRMKMEMIFKIPANNVKELVWKKKYVFQKISSKIIIENVNARFSRCIFMNYEKKTLIDENNKCR